MQLYAEWKSFGDDKRISDRPHALFLWLFNALSAGMYASHIWYTTQFLEHDNVVSNPLQVSHMAFFKEKFETSANWCVLREWAQELLQYTGSGQLPSFGIGWLIQIAIHAMCVMKADISLGKNSGASNRWTRQMKDAFGGLQNGTTWYIQKWLFTLQEAGYF